MKQKLKSFLWCFICFSLSITFLGALGFLFEQNKKAQAASKRQIVFERATTCAIDRLTDDAMEQLVVTRESIGPLLWLKQQQLRAAEGYPKCPSAEHQAMFAGCYKTHPHIVDRRDIAEFYKTQPSSNPSRYPGLSMAFELCESPIRGIVPESRTAYSDNFWSTVARTERYGEVLKGLKTEVNKVMGPVDEAQAHIDSAVAKERAAASVQHEKRERQNLRY